MKVVSRFEANLLRILRFFLRREPRDQVLPLVTSTHGRPACLSAAAVSLVEDALAKGCTLLLARTGGWRRERFLRSEHAVNGRLWERTPPAELGLEFSKHSLEFLLWMTAADPLDDKKAPWTAPLKELTDADLLLFYYAFGALRDTSVTVALAKLTPFANNGLCRLAFPEEFTKAREEQLPDFKRWTTGLGASILEALQPELAELWLRMESGKGQVGAWKELRDVGASQELILDRFFDAVEKAKRLDLAGFLLKTAARLLTRTATPQMWINDEVRNAPPRMADRVETQRAALALVRQMDRFQKWERRARGVGYFDEGYEAGQLCKDAWEAVSGDELHARAQAIIRELDPIRVQTEGRT